MLREQSRVSTAGTARPVVYTYWVSSLYPWSGIYRIKSRVSEMMGNGKGWLGEMGQVRCARS